MFKKGEKIIYGIHGVCQVDDITTMSGNDKMYYVLSPANQKDGHIYTPVDNTKVRMRNLISRKEAENLLDEVSEIDGVTVENEKAREKAYKECISNDDLESKVGLLKTIIKRKEDRITAGKKLPAVDEKYLHLVSDLLYRELSEALDTTMDKIDEYVIGQI